MGVFGLFAQASATLGITVTELVGGLAAILTVVVGPLVAAIVKMSASREQSERDHVAALAAKDAAHIADKQAQTEAHRGERGDLMKALKEERERNERQANARAEGEADARRTVADVSTAAMRLVDSVRDELSHALTTPPEERTPPSRESRPAIQALQEPAAGPLTRQPGRARRNSNA